MSQRGKRGHLISTIETISNYAPGKKIGAEHPRIRSFQRKDAETIATLTSVEASQ